MDDLVFRPTKRQRRYDVVAPAVGAMASIILYWLGDWASAVGMGAAVVAVAIALPIARGRTIVTQGGVQAIRQFRRRAWQWHEIANVDVKVEQYRTTSRWVRITTTSGKSFKLPAPYDFSLARNPDFDKHVEVVRNRWARATGRDATSEPDEEGASS